MMTKLSQRLLLLVALFVGITTSACARPAEQTPTEPPAQGDTIDVMQMDYQYLNTYAQNGLLLDLTPEAIRMIRRRNPGAVRLTGTGWEKFSPNVTNN